MEVYQSKILQGELLKEFRTLQAMFGHYCRAKHKTSGPLLCESCQSLLEYAEQRLDRCPYGENKPTCNKCPIHCYKPEPKQSVKQIMRFAGPKMLWSNPLLAIRHLRHERRPIPAKPQPKASNRHRRIAAAAKDKA